MHFENTRELSHQPINIDLPHLNLKFRKFYLSAKYNLGALKFFDYI
jgi:hypothetical protein